MNKYFKNKLLIVSLFLVTVLITGCSSKGKDEEIISDTTAKNETKIVKTDFGDVEIPTNPERVLATIVQGDVLALGVVPVGTSFNDGGVFAKDLEDSTIIDAWNLNPEEIMSLNPDLIIWNGGDQDIYDTLSKIAPTVAHDFFGMEYDDRLRMLGDILNNSEKAETLINEFDAKLEDSKALLKENGLAGSTALCMENREDILFVSWKGRGAPLMYDLLGFTLPEKLKIEAEKEDNKQPGSVKLSYEVMDQYAADVMVVNGNLGSFSDTPVWNNLPAVTADKVIYAPSNMFWFNDILSLNGQVDLIMESLIK